MRALEWLRYFEKEQRENGKIVFTCAELANVAAVPLRNMRVGLNRLQKQGVLVRYAQGRYGLPDAIAPQQLLPVLDPGAYITGSYALFLHNLITQVPREICCFTNRRHNRSRIRETPLGRFTFASIQPPIYDPPADGVLAPLEQALCDYVYRTIQRRLNPATQVTFSNLERVRTETFMDVADRYPQTTRETVENILDRRSSA